MRRFVWSPLLLAVLLVTGLAAPVGAAAGASRATTRS